MCSLFRDTFYLSKYTNFLADVQKYTITGHLYLLHRELYGSFSCKLDGMLSC